MAALDLEAEREKIQKEIEALEKSLGLDAEALNLDVSDSDEDSDDENEEQLDGDCQTDDVLWEDGRSSVEMCLQMNLVYQAVIEEKLQELEVLMAQNKEQQEEIMWELAGRKTQRAGTTKTYPLNLALGHFMKPYFKDKTSGMGPPANPEMKERSTHIVKCFQDLSGKIWKPSDSEELKKAICSDTLQKLLQPKLFKVEYLQQKHDKSLCGIEKKMFAKQICEAEREIDDINQLQEEVLLGKITAAHDWEKIANINFEGNHTAERLCRMWQNVEHPHINKKPWSEEEIKNLQDIATEHNLVNWEAIAQELGTGRTAFQCLQVYQKNDKGFKRCEFSKEEDEILTHFVQRMRVGEHIPYNKISYFMEGRDGLQLLHRWTKCIDPRLKKGPWTKEEDELLLKAVAKYGEKDWYKIREEVPGRSDIRCRERYLKTLHTGVKKGKWNQEEKMKLVALTAKYGIGHWARISRELTQRTASQCLSKWKHMTGYFKNKQYKRKLNPKSPEQQKRRKTVMAIKEEEESEELSSSSGSESSFVMSSESEDETMELMDNCSGTEISNLLQSLPDLDLWVPRKMNSGVQDKTLHVYEHSPPSRWPRKSRRKKRDDTFQFNTIVKGIGYPASTDIVTETVDDFIAEAEKNRHEILQIQEYDIMKILMQNTRESELKQILRLKPRQIQVSSGSETDQLKDRSTTVTRLYRSSLDRRLLCAVTRWVGNVFLPLSTSRGKHFKTRRRTWADEMNKKLSCVTITSTPIFTLLIQLLQIDAEGCLRMIRMRKADESQEFFRRVKTTSKKSERRNPDKDPVSPQSILVQSLNAEDMTTETAAPSTPARTRRRASVRKEKPSVSTPKPKTVSELLREKRMQKNNPAKAAGTIVLPRNILVSPQILISQPPNPTLQPQTMVLPGAPSSPLPKHLVAATNNISTNPMSLVSGGSNSRPVTDLPQIAGSPRSIQQASPSTPPAPQPLPHQVPLLPRTVLPAPSGSALPITYLLTPQGLISVQCSNLSQQLGNHRPSIVNTSVNTSATKLSNANHSNGSLGTPDQPLPSTTSSAPHSTGMSSSVLNLPQVSSTQVLAQLDTSGKPPQHLPAVTNTLIQDGTALTLIKSPVRVVGSQLLNVASAEVSKMPSVAPSTFTSTLVLKDQVSTSSVVSSPLVASPCLSSTAISDSVKFPSQPILATTTKEGTETISMVESQSQMAGSCSTLVPCSPFKASNITPVGTAPLSPAASASAIRMPSPMLPVITRSLGLEGSIVASSSTSQPQQVSTLAPGLPNKANQLILTPRKYPIVKIAKILQTEPKEVTGNMAPSSVPSNPNPTTSSERDLRLLDLKIISLEEEGSVKEWILGKHGFQVPNQKGAMSYLPPSICTLKTFSKLLLQKKTLQENAFKLLPPSDVTDVSSIQNEAALSGMVEEKLKDNLAYQLLKQRFLSTFTIPGFLSVFPPTSIDMEEDIDEDFENFIKSELNDVEQTVNDGAADGNGGNICEEATTTLEAQVTAVQSSADNSNSDDNRVEIKT